MTIKCMKNWLEENWFRIALLTTLIVSLISAFYWHDLRPSNIKKDCSGVAKEKALEKAGPDAKKFTKDDYDTYYKWCLEQNGL